MHAKVNTPAVPEDLAAADAVARTVRLRDDQRAQRTPRRRGRDTAAPPVHRQTAGDSSTSSTVPATRSTRTSTPRTSMSLPIGSHTNGETMRGIDDPRRGSRVPSPRPPRNVMRSRSLTPCLASACTTRRSPSGDLRCAIDHHAAHRWIAGGDRRRRADRAALQIDGHLGRDAGAPVVEDRPADARLRTRGLVGLGQLDRHDAH